MRREPQVDLLDHRATIDISHCFSREKAFFYARSAGSSTECFDALVDDLDGGEQLIASKCPT